VDAFFNRYELTSAGIPPQNIFNYDELKLFDNPGAKKAIFSRGEKYAEKIRD
jgi:hypothetical protein